MQLRVARHTERLDEVVAFYRDGIGLTEIGGFRDQMATTACSSRCPAAAPTRADGRRPARCAGAASGVAARALPRRRKAVRTVAARLGVDPTPPANPYWAEHGVTFQDPDGFRVVLVPERWEP
jgi:catechol 2,3-dioxygenase-like lactoylglutathione lyase family enzyme